MSHENKQTFILKDFKVDTKIPHPTILTVGKRFAGCDETIASLTDKYDYVSKWSAWCRTQESEEFWTNKLSSNNVPFSIHKPDHKGKEELENIISEQEGKVHKYSRFLNLPFPKELTLGFIFDNVLSLKEFREGPQLEDLISNGRHYKIVCLLNCQNIKQLPPSVRLNSDYIFIMHNSNATLKLLHEEYVENPKEFQIFRDLVREVTSQCDDKGKDMFNALVYTNGIKTDDLNEMFSIYTKEKLDTNTGKETDLECLIDINYQLQSAVTNLNEFIQNHPEYLNICNRNYNKSLTSSYQINIK